MKHNFIRMSNADFASLWNVCGSQTEFAEKTGYKQDTAAKRAVRLRRQGYQLKSLRNDINYEEMRRFIEDMGQRRAKFTPREVIVAYLLGVSLKRIAQVTGRTKTAISCILRMYRSHDIGLSRKELKSNLRKKYEHQRTNTDLPPGTIRAEP